MLSILDEPNDIETAVEVESPEPRHMFEDINNNYDHNSSFEVKNDKDLIDNT